MGLILRAILQFPALRQLTGALWPVPGWRPCAINPSVACGIVQPRHSQKQQPVSKAADICRTGQASAVMNRDFDNLQIQFRRTEDQIEVTKQIEVAKIFSIRGNLLIIGMRQHVGSAKGVLKALIQKIRQHDAEKAIAIRFKNRIASSLIGWYFQLIAPCFLNSPSHAKSGQAEKNFEWRRGCAVSFSRFQ